MGRSKLVGLCILAASALGAIAASAAQANPAEFYACAKATPKSTGRYSDKECSSYVGSAGAYERVSAIGTTFKSKFKTTVFTTRPLGAGATVTCKSGTATGKIYLSNFASDYTTFHGCSMGGVKCASAGQRAGTIESNQLKIEAIGTESDAKIRLSASAGYMEEFTCGGTLVRTSGLPEATFTSPPPGHASKKSTEVFGGEDNLNREESFNGGETWSSGVLTEESVTVESTASEPVGIN
jgi:hypothetical protein